MSGHMCTHRRWLVFATALTMGGSGVAVAQVPSGTDHGTLRAILDGIRQQFDLPALAAMSMRGDSVIDIAATGIRAAGFSEEVTIRDRWHLGSLTKAMTATLAAILIERGTVSWSTTIRDVFPDLTDSIRSEFTNVRLDELLSHTSGLAAAIGFTASWRTLRSDTASYREQRARWIGEILSLPPGTQRGSYLYSNGNYVVAGAMLEALSGEAWEDLMRHELFEPLGMTETGFGPPGSPDTRDQPRGHRYRNAAFEPIEPGPEADNPAALGPAGTVHATLGDYGKFVAAHLAGARGSDGIVPAGTFRRLHTPVADSYALGWIVVERAWAEGRALSHSGSNTMWYATVWMAPALDVALIAVCNAGTAQAATATDRAVAALLERISSTAGR